MNTVLYHTTMALLRLTARLPLSALYVLSDVVCLVVYRLLHYRRRIVRLNIDNSFPEKSTRERRAIEQGFYRTLCDNIVETIKLLHISDDELRRRINVMGVELVDDIAREGRPVFLFIGHYGNWEWVQEVPSRFITPMYSAEIYKPIHNPVFDRVMQTIRAHFPNGMIPQAQTLRTLIALRKEHGTFLIGFISDQRPARTALNHWTTFLGQPTPYLTGAEHIGSRLDARYLYLDIEKPRRGHYTMTIRQIQPQQDTQQEEYPYSCEYMRMLEGTIRRQPELWLWSHNRWKHQHDGSAGNSEIFGKQ